MARCLVIVMMAVAAIAQARSFEVAMEGGSGQCRSATLVATATTPEDGPAGPAEIRRTWSIPVPGSAAVDLAPEVGWTLRAECPGMWAPDVRLEPGEAEDAIRISLLPAGAIAGRIARAGALLRVDGRLEVQLQPELETEDLGWRSATVECPLRQGEFECVVPASSLDLRLGMEGFAPEYAWGVRISTGETVDLGALELVEGASVVGWVAVPRAAGQDAPAAIVVAVEPLVLDIPGTGDRQRLELRTQRAGVDQRGFFQLTGLAPGRYGLAVALPGHSPARISPIDLERGHEYVVETPIALDPLLTLELFVDPPHDSAGRPWHIHLMGDARPTAGANFREEIAASVATSAGYWSRDDLATGSYLVQVEDAESSIWSEIPVDVSPGLGPLTIQLPAVAVEGEVRLGGEPVAAELIFGTSTGSPVVRLTSDEEGRFSGVLPREGEWQLEVRLSDRPPQALDPVEVRRGAGGVAELSLRLPDTRLAGSVVSEHGEPAAGVHVLVVREEAKATAPERDIGVEHRRRREASVITDRHGRFEVEGLLPASLLVVAHDAARSSRWLEVELEEDEPTSPLRLVLLPRTELSGQVISPDGPVAGAIVLGLPRGGVAPFDPFAQGVTGADGRFTFEVMSGSELVDLFVAPSGYDIVFRRIALPARPLTITVARTGGRLKLEGSRPGAALLHAGAEMPIQTLLSMLFPLGRIELDADALAIEGLEPGGYALCSGKGSAPCASGHLAAGTELVLRGPDGNIERASP